jgi:hypothetical protein
MLMAEDDAGAGYAFSRGLGALATGGFLLVALQLPLTTSQAAGKHSQVLEKGRRVKGAAKHSPTSRFGSASLGVCRRDWSRIGGSRCSWRATVWWS